MNTFVKLYSNVENEIFKFLNKYYKFSQPNLSKLDKNAFEWKKEYNNPIEMADIIGCFIDNNDKYKINMWICLDKDVLINVTDNNQDEIIRYLYERYPN